MLNSFAKIILRQSLAAGKLQMVVRPAAVMLMGNQSVRPFAYH